jgi:hypothetical protein
MRLGKIKGAGWPSLKHSLGFIDDDHIKGIPAAQLTLRGLRLALACRKKATSRTPDGKMPGESKSSPREIQSYLGQILRSTAIAINFPSVQLNAGLARHDYFEINCGDAIK